MIDRIGPGPSLAREAVEAALRAHGAAARAVGEEALRLSQGAEARPEGPAFAQRLLEGLAAVDEQVKRSGDLPAALAAGRIQDFHEIAGQLKQAELTFKFALEVRNKLIEAYRETMRMSV